MFIDAVLKINMVYLQNKCCDTNARELNDYLLIIQLNNKVRIRVAVLTYCK